MSSAGLDQEGAGQVSVNQDRATLKTLLTWANEVTRQPPVSKPDLVSVRVGKALVGLAEPLYPWLERTDGVVIIGLPGVGKTTLLRDALRIVSERLAGRLFVSDSSNEILGDGRTPHPLTGWMSPVMIGDPALQWDKVNRTVKNMQPR